MIWILIAIGIGLVGFLIYWYWRPGRVHALAVVAKVEVRTSLEGQKEYSARVRLFDPDLIASNEWWPLGAFPSISEAVYAIRKFHGERVTDDNWFAFSEDGRPSVLRLGDFSSRRES